MNREEEDTLQSRHQHKEIRIPDNENSSSDEDEGTVSAALAASSHPAAPAHAAAADAAAPFSSPAPPYPGPRRSCANGLCRAAPGPAAVTFCAIQLEVAEDAPDVDLRFSRGKSLEDVFKTLDLANWSEPSKAMSSRKKSRGRRQMAEVTVQTFTGDDLGAAKEEASATASGAEAVAATKGEESKKSSKESTPASTASSKDSSAKDGSDSGCLNFVSGNPFVEVTKGVLHLYKENETTSLEEGVIRSQMLCKTRFVGMWNLDFSKNFF